MEGERAWCASWQWNCSRVAPGDEIVQPVREVLRGRPIRLWGPRSAAGTYAQITSSYGIGQIVGWIICIVLVIAIVVWFVRRRRNR